MALRPVSGLGVQRYVPHLAGIPSIAWSFELALAQYPVPGILFSSIQREPDLQQNVIIANNATSAKVQIEDREGNEGPRLVVSGGVEAGDVLMGGASGAPATIVPGREPESRDAGVSRFGEIGSHLEGADTAEGHAGQVERSGMSGKCRNRLTPGSNGLQQWARGGPVTAAPNAPYRIRPPVVRDGLAGQYCTENGLVVYVRPILAPGPHAAVAAKARRLAASRRRGATRR